MNPIIVGADLAPAALTTTTTLASPNFTFPVTTTVKNQGGQAANASAVRFFLNSVNSLNGSPIPLGVTATATVAPGASVISTTRLTIPGNTSVGSYFVLAQVDGDAQVTEADETNNVRATASPINVQLPDLKIISVNPPAASIRGKVTGAPLGTVVVKNIGLGPSAPFNVQVFANRDEGDGSGSDAPGLGDIIFTRTVPLLAAGAQTTVTGPIIVPETVASVVRLAGNYYMSAVADPTGTATRDPSTGDNVLTRTTKKIPVLPDMTKLQTASVDLTLQPACGSHDPGAGRAVQRHEPDAGEPLELRRYGRADRHAGLRVRAALQRDGHGAGRRHRGTAGKILSSFTYTATIANDFASSGSGTINGAAPALNFTGGSITGRQAGLPSCTFAGSIDIVR